MPADFTDVEGVENTYDDRPTRPCMACGQQDKAPRDVVALPDGNAALYHKDCHALMGCAVCKAELDALAKGPGPKGLKNEDLWVAIVKEMLKPAGERVEIHDTIDATGDLRRNGTNEELKAAGMELK